jgi:hypothetical protein
MNTPYPAAVRPSDLESRRRSAQKDPYKDELADSSSNSEEDESDDLGNGVQVFVEEQERDRERERVPRKPVGGGRKKGKGR